MTKVRTAAAGLAISGAALVGIATYEGYRDNAYQDTVNVWTIGFGETAGVKPGQKTDPVRALVQLQASADKHAKGMVECITAPISQNEFDAYLSFTYNVGVGAFCRSSLVKLLNQGKYEEACAELKKWVYAGGKPLAGLVTRRKKEYQTCIGE